MNFIDCIKTSNDILMEDALGERLKREYNLTFDESIAMASLIYSVEGKVALENLWSEYAQIAFDYHLPFLATTPTRRVNKERMEKSQYNSNIIKVDFLYVALMPTLEEAAGMAFAIEKYSIPYIISFTINKDGCLIDGTSIRDIC